MASTKPRPAAALAMARLTSCSTISTTASKFVKRVLRRQNRRCRRCRERQARLCPPPRKKWNQRRIENARWVRHRISPEDAHVETAASAVPRKPALSEVERAKPSGARYAVGRIVLAQCSNFWSTKPSTCASTSSSLKEEELITTA